ncbi:MAG: enoyl-CoA hydratase/isomerase family protein [Deltaproteobacteria bacterium]|nr:enoyl-CoA hydratase/isomerase family protein [Deltaproteobacteria bacterium]MBW2082821.1 enoyl-CoA hydratase/isomerase family protein [Deltaproteobacteria bacterium]RLB86324.1 MAG: enoyl-CoA hydratase/isomerase family protein [Deltaproteobacteria bacterium]
MNDRPVIVDRKDHIGIISLNRPDQFNTFNTALATELNRALIELDNDAEIRVVVIRGIGKAFSAGIDVSEYFGKTQREYYEWVSLMERMVHVIAYMKKPVIASAHGFAVANGAGLIAACDLAVVAEGTKIGATAINVGLFCMGPAVPMSRSLGRKRCLEMLLTGDMIDAHTAEQWGLVNKVVPAEKLEEATIGLAQKLAEKSPLALQMGKRAFYGMSDMEYGKALEYSNEVFAALCTTEDAEEGIKAFLEKRKPVWKGR